MESFPLPLKMCFFSDKILLVLDEILQEEKVDENAQEILKEANEFFSQVLLGKEFVESLKVDTKLIEASSLYGIALDVLIALKRKKKIPEEASIEEILMEYQNTLSAINDDFQFNSLVKSLHSIRQFFTMLRTISADRIERPIEQVTIIGGFYQ